MESFLRQQRYFPTSGIDAVNLQLLNTLETGWDEWHPLLSCNWDMAREWGHPGVDSEGK